MKLWYFFFEQESECLDGFSALKHEKWNLDVLLFFIRKSRHLAILVLISWNTMLTLHTNLDFVKTIENLSLLQHTRELQDRKGPRSSWSYSRASTWSKLNLNWLQSRACRFVERSKTKCWKIFLRKSSKSTIKWWPQIWHHICVDVTTFWQKWHENKALFVWNCEI